MTDYFGNKDGMILQEISEYLNETSIMKQKKRSIFLLNVIVNTLLL